MIDRTTKLRFRRIWRRRRKQVEEIGYTAEENLDKHFVRRLTKLFEVRRFLLGWVGLLVILMVGVLLQSRALSSHYQVQTPVDGGMFTEGILGTFTNASPLYSTNLVDSSVSKLVFSGLLTYDNKGQLVNDLADGYTVDATEKVYTVKLKKDVHWQDGRPLTANDVAFTYKLIQNPETRSHLLSSWRGIDVKAPDDHTVVFTLPNNLSAFPHSLTNGIVPQHLLGKVPPSQLRSNSFNNQSPVGSGPFSFNDIEVQDKQGGERISRIILKANDLYYRGAPSLERFIVKSYNKEERLLQAYGSKDVDAMAGLNTLSDQQQDDTTKQYSLELTGQVMTFFKNDQEILKDPVVRRALTLGINKATLLSALPYPLASVDEPLLKMHSGYNKAYAQVTNRKDEAKALLDSAGWKADPATGMRAKDGKKLTFRLFSGTSSEFTSVSGGLQKQWHDLGVDVQVSLQSDEELQSTVSTHNYDALLYGISIGPDPDVFAYWHSTQADPRSDTRLNFSEYKSTVADKSLEAGRTRSDPANRAVKYRPFIDAWRTDNPALALYQPRFLYVVREPLYDFNTSVITSPADRFANVENWKVHSENQKR